MTFLLRAAFVLLAISLSACGRAEDTAPPVATPSVTLARSAASIGSPLEMTYRFAVAEDAPAFSEDYWVFVHFLDADGELMWTDDHQPPTPTRQWKPGQAIEYERTMFVPKFPYTGQTLVEVGLFSRQTSERLPLNGDTRGQRSYQVAAFDLTEQGESQFVIFRTGWHPTEVADDEVGTEWQWSKKEATLTFRNPKRDVAIYLQVDQPVARLPTPQQVEVRIGETVVDSFSLAPAGAELREFPVSASQLGSADTVEMTIVVDRTFVPARMPALESRDPRELGIRVFRAYVDPR
jgi:hypothetical protein